MSLEGFKNLKADAEPSPETELNPELIQRNGGLIILLQMVH